MPKFHLPLRTRREFNIAYILNRPGIKWEIVWSSHAPSSSTTSLPFAISDLDEQLGIQGSETSQTHILLIAIAIVFTAICMPTVYMALQTSLPQPHFLLLFQFQQQGNNSAGAFTGRKAAEPDFEGHLGPTSLSLTCRYLYQDLFIEYLLGKRRRAAPALPAPL